MRLFKYATAAMFVLAGVFGILIWQNSRKTENSTQDFSVDMSKIKVKFQEEIFPVSKINLDDFRKQKANIELIDPKTTLPHYDSYPFEEVSSLFAYSLSCKNSQSIHLENKELTKAFIWHRFLCLDLAKLPIDFFSTKPLMHPSGVSYAKMAMESGREDFLKKDWLQENQNKIHALEALNQQTKAGITAWEFQNMLNGESLIETSSYILFANQSYNKEDSVTSYNQYDKKNWKHFLASRKYLSTTQNESLLCLIKEGNICWVKNPSVNNSRLKYLVFSLLLGFVFLGIVFFLRLLEEERKEKIESEKKLFTIQMLTHELRTPVTSLLLLVEELRKQFDELPQSSQRAFLKICDELQMLNKVVYSSEKYLQTSNKKFIDAKNIQNVSINDLVSTIVSSFSQDVQFLPLNVDRKMFVDPYWIEICIKNLIENALRHGKEPVVVSLSEEKNSLIISVEDQGYIDHSNFEEMLSPFYKSSTSRGLGLGLAIVKKIVEAMNGELKFKSNPTTFKICLKGKENENIGG